MEAAKKIEESKKESLVIVEARVREVLYAAAKARTDRPSEYIFQMPKIDPKFLHALDERIRTHLVRSLERARKNGRNTLRAEDV